MKPSIPSAEALTAEILRRTEAASPGASICPSEVARGLAPADAPDSWRSSMHAVRQAAMALQREGRIEILRKGKPVPPEEVRGVIRLRVRKD